MIQRAAGQNAQGTPAAKMPRMLALTKVEKYQLVVKAQRSVQGMQMAGTKPSRLMRQYETSDETVMAKTTAKKATEQTTTIRKSPRSKGLPGLTNIHTYLPRCRNHTDSAITATVPSVE
jgi:hypothetical protein